MANRSEGSRVDAELVRRGLARSRDDAVTMVAAGRVRLDGCVVTKPALRVGSDGDLVVEADPEDPGYASRGAHKLAGALAEFRSAGLDVAGRRCLDVGASTGGFTDVLLRLGAGTVICVDVGHQQLVPRLRDDPRTLVLEGCNVRRLTRDQIGGGVELVVADVSFISLVLVLPAISGVATSDGDLVLLVKPQFEVGRGRLGAGGVVRDPGERARAIHGVADAAGELGWGVHGVTRSRLPGPSGNVEYFLWLRRGPGEVAPEAIDRAVTAVPDGEKVFS